MVFNYAMTPSAMSFTAARDFCSSHFSGGHLATVSSQQISQQLMSLSESEGHNCFSGWIGFSDMTREGTWVWDSMSDTDYTHWMEGEPNNMEDSGRPVNEDGPDLCMTTGPWDEDDWEDWEGTGQDCAYIGWNCYFGGLEVNGNTHRWDDLNCGAKLYGFCEYEESDGNGDRGRRLLSSDNSACETGEGWQEYQGRCFKSVGSSMNMAACLERCACEGATLACPWNGRTNDFFQNELMENDFAWLGITDQIERGKWQCVSYDTPDEISWDKFLSEEEEEEVEEEWETHEIFMSCATIMEDGGDWLKMPCDSSRLAGEFDGEIDCLCQKGPTKREVVSFFSKVLDDNGWEEDWEREWEEEWEWEDDDWRGKGKGRRGFDDDDAKGALGALIFFFFFILAVFIIFGCVCLKMYRSHLSAKVEIARITSGKNMQQQVQQVEMSTFSRPPQHQAQQQFSQQIQHRSGNEVILGGERRQSHSPMLTSTSTSVTPAGTTATIPPSSVTGSTNYQQLPDFPYAKAEYAGS